MSQLLQEYELQGGEQRLVCANRIFDLVYKAEITDEPIEVTSKTPADSVEMMVWHWAGEYFWEMQDYCQSLHFSQLALPLAYRLGDMKLQSDCENLIGLNYFRMSDYARAVENLHKSLALDRQTGDKSRISSSLNTLAGICLVAKQLDDGEKYILEAIRYSTEAKDSNRIAIQYGMASELYHAMNREQLAIEYAQKAYEIDAARGNTAKMGIRLSQKAAAQDALGQYADAELSLRQAIQILEKTDNLHSLAICRNQMGEMLNRRGAFDKAAIYFKEAADFFYEKNDIYNESRSQMGLYEALKGINLAEADRHLLRYSALKDSIYRHDMEFAVSRQNAIYKTEELIEQQKFERRNQRLARLGGIAVVVILLLIIGVLGYLSKVHRHSHEALEKLAELRENFFTNITHEFRTPLTVILGLSHDLQCSGSDEVRNKAIAIQKQGNGLLSLVNQLLDITKIKSSIGDAEWKNGNVIAYLGMVVESYRDFALSHNITFQFLPKGEVVMDFVPDYIVKVMNNLLSNALKFTPEYGTVSVSAWREGEQLHIDVTDSGCGMDKDTLAQVFEPFYQGESGKRHIGTGVGLTLVKQIIDALDGRITVNSEINNGTTFHISLPIRNNIKSQVIYLQTGNPTLLPDIETKLEDSKCYDNRYSLLIIEDNRDIAAYIGAQFDRTYAISYASNGKEGLEKALGLVPDLIITDLRMPVMDGLEVCRQVRKNEIINHIPIIAVTAKITEKDIIAGLEAGADAYISKPFNPDELRMRVEKLLDGRRLLREKYAHYETAGNGQNSTQHDNADLRFLSKVSSAVYSQISQKKRVNVSAIASNVCMSNSQFYRKLLALTGYKPSSYIQYIKIRKAKNLLDNNPQMSLVEVADECGFEAYPNFVRAFKNVLNITPSEYRKKETWQ